MVMLEKVLFNEESNVKEDVANLLVTAFPKDERPPVDIFFHNLSINKENTRLLAFYIENNFIGFTSLVLYKDICYIFFLAVSPTFQNKGYGTQIINIIKEDYKDYVILLAYEEVDEKYPNYAQRKSREAFYLKRGFKDNGFISEEWGVRFQSAYIGKRRVSFEEYIEIFKIGFNINPKGYLKRG